MINRIADSSPSSWPATNWHGPTLPLRSPPRFFVWAPGTTTAEPGVDRYDQLDDVLGTAATAFLGITLRCARCHDHKFEPFSQTDYYGMLAVFEPLSPAERPDRLDRPVGTEAELAAYHASLAKHDADFEAIWSRIEPLIKPEIDEFLSPAQNSKDGKPTRKHTSLPPLAIATFRLSAANRKPAHRTVVKHFAAQLWPKLVN